MAHRKRYLTVRQVMDHLQVGRTFVYEQARLYLASGGAEGLPCRKFGRLLRFPLDEIDAPAHGSPTHRAPVVELDARRPATRPTGAPAGQRPTVGRATGTDSSARPAG